MHQGFEFYTYLDNKGEWRWAFRAIGNRETIAVSSESFKEYRDCLYDLNLVKQFAASAAVK
jgi:uncharacterized protein YegP (UPF0339 family)